MKTKSGATSFCGMFFSTLLPRFSDPLTRSGKFFEKLKANSKRYKVSLGFIYTNLRFIYICIYLHCRGRKIGHWPFCMIKVGIDVVPKSKQNK